MKPLVSIITPMYNNEDVIKETIDSVSNQSYSNWELILVDDFSSDETVKTVQPLVLENSRIKLFQHSKNRGAAKARNFGTEMAKGSYIAFLDADDLWCSNKLELQLEALKRADVCFGSYELVDANTKPLKVKVKAIKSLSYKKLIKANYIGNLTGIYNSSKLGKIYTKDLKKRQDWLLWLEALKRSKMPAIGISDTIAYYRITEGSLSSNKVNLIKYNFDVYRNGLGFSFPKSLLYMIGFLFEHLIVKKRLIKTIP